VWKAWESTDILTQPQMQQEGIALLEEKLQQTDVYLEYGTGSSTMLAAEFGVQHIHSIDSNRGLLNAVQRRISERQPNVKMKALYVDIGPTKELVQPADLVCAQRLPHYCVAAWDLLLSQNLQPDLILINGQYRVASFLASLVFAKSGTVILFDDYFDRPHYHLVEKYLRPSARAGRMAEFIVDASFSPSQVLLDLIRESTNPA